MAAFDIVVIGAGPGGYPAAIRAAQLGASVALVEREEMGGTCLNWGCIPTKTLIASSELLARIKSAGAMGLHVGNASFDYAAMSDRKDQIVQKLRNGIKQLLKANGVTVIPGAASFQSRNRIEVNASSGAELLALTAGKTIIATGAASVMPGFLPRHERVVESKSFLNLRALPASALVLGGGIIGCEFACMLAQLGVTVTVVELLEDILAVVDADVRRELRRHMEKSLGIRILTGVTLEDIAADDRGVRGRAGQETLNAELLLVALGRKPVTGALKLENAGLAPNARGFLDVDAYGRTSVATVYAVGDVTGGPLLAHAATAQGLVAAENACGLYRHKNEALVPNCIFTTPEIGTVGLGETEAQQQGRKIKTGKYLFGALGKAMAIGEPVGFVKWVADGETEQLLGAHAVGPHATDIIAEAAVAIRAELTASDLAHTVHAHPTLAEAWMEAAHTLTGEPIHSAPPRKSS
ncbi:MAG TPA: dihydrolipoyl dehydrogenase [Candidatus Acidoferrales bacterium]|nr:dihydrolipoyl dehydrogenase [Candidatus Acidoferrales bacterium]